MKISADRKSIVLGLEEAEDLRLWLEDYSFTLSRFCDDKNIPELNRAALNIRRDSVFEFMNNLNKEGEKNEPETGESK